MLLEGTKDAASIFFKGPLQRLSSAPPQRWRMERRLVQISAANIVCPLLNPSKMLYFTFPMMQLVILSHLTKQNQKKKAIQAKLLEVS